MQPVGASGRVAFLVPAPLAPGLEWQGIESLENCFWLVGRLRLDRRRELRAALGDKASAHDSDGRLCLLAYAAWGDAFLDRLAGDFCFVLWDEAGGVLLGARDQLGMRSLFHAEAGGLHFVSDSLDWIADQREVDCTLDDTWIADFLAVGSSLDLDRSVYRDIRRLPPAHVLAVSRSGVRLRRYWRLEVAEPLYYRHRNLYFERFRELVSSAVADRLPSAGRVGISMSGGLDSTTMAAFAVALTGDPTRVVAVCDCFERLMDDPEPRFAALAADHLGIELRLNRRDDVIYDPEWRSRDFTCPEPSPELLTAHFERSARRRMAEEAPVWLFGEGPDNALSFERDAYLSWLARRGDWGRLVEAVMLYIAAKGIGSLRQTVRRYAGSGEPAAPSPQVPPWLERDFVERLRIADRLRASRDTADRSHGWHPRAIGSFNGPLWPALFRDLELDGEQAGMAWRCPFLDLAVLQFMLSVPPVPWAREKLLVRRAMRGRLPEAILRRPKTPVAVLPDDEVVGSHLGSLPASGRLDGYVDVARVPARFAGDGDPYMLVAPHVLDHWIMYSRRR